MKESKKATFQILCVTMNQYDFSKIDEMNIHSNVVFANQCNKTSYEEKSFEGKTAKMISTSTRGVGKNRNIALCYADADICLLADDDIKYSDDAESLILGEFEDNPKADIIIFHLESTDSKRTLKPYKTTRRRWKIEPRPWGAVRIAFRTQSVKMANLWFTTLFGGGCLFPSGEDSMWIDEAFKKGLRVYVSNKTIGTIKMETSSWFTGYDEKYFFGKGAFYQASYPKMKYLWLLYFAYRTKNMSELSFVKRVKWIKCGMDGYLKMMSYDDYVNPMEGS